MTVNDRIEKLREKMKANKLDAYIIPSADPHQSEYVADYWKARAWISGFTGSAGTVIITNDHAGLWTDSRYFLQAEQELSKSEVELHKLIIPHTPQHIDWMLNSLAPKSKVGCDGRLFSVAQIRSLSKNLYANKIDILADQPLLDEIWTDRPVLPSKVIFEHDIKYAGRSRTQKLDQVREAMKAQDADYHLIPTLDDIAWALNIRSSDVQCNPVSIAFLVIGIEKSFLFIDAEKVPEAIRLSLGEDGVLIKPYQAISSFLSSLEKDKILVNPNRVNIDLYNSIPEEAVLKGATLTTPLKALKNEVEIEHIKNAMLKDGIALTKLFMWLEQALTKRSVSEAELALVLAKFRSQQADYHGESFDAIVGYEANGAIIHYKPEEATCAQIQPKGILLLDSGGQYIDGTTDITRTVALGSPTAEQIRNFTLVLKGCISLSMLHFLKGTRGNQMEILARLPLWEAGLNYGHGTGHGVGFFLNVHEGPQAFGGGATAKAAVPFKAGMLTSNEPGFYKAGAYGIRIENLILAVKDRTTEYGEFLKFETVTLFPIDQNLIEVNLLTAKEKAWLNAYHKEVFEKLSQHLTEAEQQWLREKCKHIE